MPKEKSSVSRKQMNEVKSFLDSQYVSEDTQNIRIKELVNKELAHHAGHTSSQKAEFFITLLKLSSRVIQNSKKSDCV